MAMEVAAIQVVLETVVVQESVIAAKTERPPMLSYPRV
jgi:hypothetical protein